MQSKADLLWACNLAMMNKWLDFERMVYSFDIRGSFRLPKVARAQLASAVRVAK